MTSALTPLHGPPRAQAERRAALTQITEDTPGGGTAQGIGSHEYINRRA